MTKAQSKIFRKLQKRQVNQADVQCVEVSESSCAIFVAFPGLYLTYDAKGKLIETQTIIERVQSNRTLAGAGNLILNSEMG